ncbi:MAG: alpha/beta hydrolase [Rhizobiaceae bacterium]|nr:alpha/beta hydrolase [Rhizobiaceae bacterium]
MIFLLLAAALVVALAFYHPPMRLMPAPEVFLKSGTNVFAPNPELIGDPNITLFYATNRMPFGPRDNRLYAVVPGRDLHMGEVSVRIGDENTTWDKIYKWSTGSTDSRRPFIYLDKLDEQASFTDGESLNADAQAWFAEINKALADHRYKNIIVYVHGANTTVERAAGQAAQLYHFTGRNAVVLLFVWPTAENFLRYSRDMVTAFGAAPHLAKLVEMLSENTDAQKIDVFTYSAGATVGSDALAIVGEDAQKPGGTPARLGEIYHAAPDADFRGFVDDMKDYAAKSERVTVAVNLNDSALRLSQVINRASRAGRPDMEELTPEATDWLLDAARDDGDVEVLRVRPENIPGLSTRSHAFWYDDPWVSSDVLISLLFHLPADQRGLDEGLGPSGPNYWTFGTDYPERLAQVIDRLRQKGEVVPFTAPQ